ncbi:SDR family oxidoreductase [Mucilaginibacter sp. OK098]|uniref:SDR family oxidoreductase n=1 Tax=Mucilaginibacter sp. OK098 TaxID=1855297 RepID=UPI0009166EE9|nr:aldehyde reductase [Mucilaginibacter sp. OK098]SHN21037.1 Nucleoside-diphosphate-sugar epimerase [Mucilaginibacter sp. OK098]
MTINSNSEKTVLVTGGSGFIAVHCILQLLNAGYNVRTTVRSLTREAEVRAMLKEGGAGQGNRLSFIEADLAADTNWPEALAGCTYVLHVASPTPLKNYSHEDEMIIPAREGVLRVLRAARDVGVKRVVLTSAFGAIAFGHQPQTAPFSETDWTDLSGKVPTYQKSKTLAERAAWDFIAREGGGLELSVVNPVAVLGPVLGADYSHSIHIIQRLMKDKAPGSPKINCGFVDVRDVADLHLRAMTDPAANGERFLATAGESIWLVDIARVLKRRMGNSAEHIKVKELPNWLLHVAALWDPAVKVLVPMLGKVMNSTSKKAIRMLGWSPRSTEEAIVATAESLVRLGLVNK